MTPSLAVGATLGRDHGSSPAAPAGLPKHSTAGECPVEVVDQVGDIKHETIRQSAARVRGVLGASLRGAFPGLTARDDYGETVLTGWRPDQAALHGVLAQVESLNLEVIEVRRRSAAAPDG